MIVIFSIFVMASSAADIGKRVFSRTPCREDFALDSSSFMIHTTLSV